jgi:hypothetical protein
VHHEVDKDEVEATVFQIGQVVGYALEIANLRKLGPTIGQRTRRGLYRRDAAAVATVQSSEAVPIGSANFQYLGVVEPAAVEQLQDQVAFDRQGSPVPAKPGVGLAVDEGVVLVQGGIPPYAAIPGSLT